MLPPYPVFKVWDFVDKAGEWGRAEEMAAVSVYKAQERAAASMYKADEMAAVSVYKAQERAAASVYEADEMAAASVYEADEFGRATAKVAFSGNFEMKISVTDFGAFAMVRPYKHQIT